ncbi:hypothetical protein SMICM304S_01835 [Streptomyces microflavus]
MRLDVGVFGAEEGGGAAYGDALGGVRVLAAAVVAGARVPLGVLVGERGAEGGQDRGEVKFSAATSWRVAACRSRSATRTPATSGSWRSSAPKSWGRSSGAGGAAAGAAGEVTGMGRLRAWEGRVSPR